MNFQITDKVVYRTTIWTIETEEDTYHVQCQEGELYDDWYITADNEGLIDNESGLGQQLLEMCNNDTE